jgi:chromosome segregation ATPase
MIHDITKIEAEYNEALKARTAARAKATKALNAWNAARRAHSTDAARLQEAAKEAAEAERAANQHLRDVILSAPEYTPEA